VSLTSPTAGTTFNAPATVTVTANAADADGTISKVDFYDGATLVGTATASPFTVTLNGVAAGSHSYTAVATDNRNATATSAAVAINVNAPPTVSITAPAANASFNAPASIAVTAAAADSDGTITKVDFYAGATLIGTATASPYTIQWTNVAAGSYALTAVATDNSNATTTSSAVAITVNAAPTVSITAPVANAIFTAPANITVTATAADTDGAIQKVDFYQGATLVGTATSSPYSANVSGLAAGSYSFTAVATDSNNATTTSAAISVRVNAVPTVSLTSPASGTVFGAPASINLEASASDTDGTIAKVEFFQGATLVGTVTSAPYTATVSGLAAGSYSFTAVATDNDGATATSEAASVTVNAAPSVSITSPANNASFNAPASITITANATDSDGTISQVELYANATLIATITTAPYTFNWTSVAAGTYALTARATDNNNAVTVSTAVNITVQVAKSLYFIHPDNLNTPRLIADATGTAVWSRPPQEPFGVSPPNENPSGLGVFEFPLRESNYYDDKETGLHYSYLRDCLDPATGRFCQADPAGTVFFRDIGFRSLGGLGLAQPKLADVLYSETPRYNHPYSYVGNNPISFTDPLGLERGTMEQRGYPSGPADPNAKYRICMSEELPKCPYGTVATCATICAVTAPTGPGALGCAIGCSCTVGYSCYELTNMYCKGKAGL